MGCLSCLARCGRRTPGRPDRQPRPPLLSIESGPGSCAHGRTQGAALVLAAAQLSYARNVRQRAPSGMQAARAFKHDHAQSRSSGPKPGAAMRAHTSSARCALQLHSCTFHRPRIARLYSCCLQQRGCGTTDRLASHQQLGAVRDRAAHWPVYWQTPRPEGPQGASAPRHWAPTAS